MLAITPRASALIDVDALRRAARPAGPLGVRARDEATPFGSGQRAAWRAERKACRVLATAAAADPTLAGVLRDRLANIESAEDALRRAAAGDADEPDLFRVKRFVHQAWRLVQALEQAGALKSYERAPLDGRALERVLRVFDGDGEIRSRFTLHDALDPRLEPLRAQVRELRRSESKLARNQRESVEARWSVRLHGGIVRVDSRDAALSEMLASGDFEVVAPGPIETELRVFPSPELEELRGALEEADDALDAVEAEVVRALGEKLAPRLERLVELERWIGRLDFRAAKVTLAADWPAWPEPDDETAARNAWLPSARGRVVESGGTWQPVDVALGSGVTLLTGPNMGGKTVALGILATIQYLGQLGYPAPARSATFRWVDAVDYVGGELGSFSAGLSSFAGEIAALSAALVRPGTSLLLIDELGKGTSPSEGKAIAAAAARHLVGRGHSCMLVTHFARLAEDVDCTRLRVRGLADVSDEELRELAASHGWSAALNSAMDYRLVEDDGTHERSDALRIARLLGLPESIVDDAIAALEPDVDDR